MQINSYGIHQNLQQKNKTIFNMNSLQNYIFTPITPEIASVLKQDSLCLESSFWVGRQHLNQVLLILTHHYLAIKNSHHSQYQFCVALNFDLKFEIIYESAESTILPEYQKKIGFKLIKNQLPPFQIFLKSEKLIDIWLKFLSQSLNQIGFHKLYKPIKKIGKGGFATVYEVERLTDKKKFAVKAFSKAATIHSDNPAHRQNLLNEIKMLRSFDNPHILQLEGIYESDNSLYVVTELLGYGQLHSRINKCSGYFEMSEVKQFMIGLAKGLKELHEKRVMHRDIKPQNIMLRSDKGLEPVIVDFGLSANVDSDDYIFYRCGTPGYVAPQITTLKKGQKIEPTCDIFSAGAIFHLLLTRKPLFDGKKFEEVYENNKNLNFNLSQSFYRQIDSDALDLLEKMLQANPEKRITASEMLNHPYLSNDTMDNEEKYPTSPKNTEVSLRKKNFSLAERAY